MEKRNMYELGITVESLPGCDVLEGLQYAYVDCYVPCANLEESISMMKDVLSREKIGIRGFEYVRRLEMGDYQPSEEGYPSVNDLREGLKNDQIILAPFFQLEE